MNQKRRGGGIHQISIPRPVNMALRAVELIAAGVSLTFPPRFECTDLVQIVTGIIGFYIHPYAQKKVWPAKRFIFAEVWACISIVVSIVWVVPSLSDRIPWLADFSLSVGWWISFALILKTDYIATTCGKFFSMPPNDNGFCRNWKSVEAFCFLSGVAWFVTGLFGIQFVQQRRRGGRGGSRFY